MEKTPRGPAIPARTSGRGSDDREASDGTGEGTLPPGRATRTAATTSGTIVIRNGGIDAAGSGTVYADEAYVGGPRGHPRGQGGDSSRRSIARPDSYEARHGPARALHPDVRRLRRGPRLRARPPGCRRGPVQVVEGGDQGPLRLRPGPRPGVPLRDQRPTRPAGKLGTTRWRPRASSWTSMDAGRGGPDAAAGRGDGLKRGRPTGTSPRVPPPSVAPVPSAGAPSRSGLTPPARSARGRPAPSC